MVIDLRPPNKGRGRAGELWPLPLFLKSYFARDIFLGIYLCVILQGIQNFFDPETPRILLGSLDLFAVVMQELKYFIRTCKTMWLKLLVTLWKETWWSLDNNQGVVWCKSLTLACFSWGIFNNEISITDFSLLKLLITPCMSFLAYLGSFGGVDSGRVWVYTLYHPIGCRLIIIRWLLLAVLYYCLSFRCISVEPLNL